MQVMTRRLLVISAISLGGGVTGLALGNFVAGSERPSGAQELATLTQANAFEDAGLSDDPAFSDLVPAVRDGPSYYDCKGCDAGLHARNDAVDLSPVELMPAYDPDAAAEPPLPPKEVPRSTRTREEGQPDPRFGSAPLVVE